MDLISCTAIDVNLLAYANMLSSAYHQGTFFLLGKLNELLAIGIICNLYYDPTAGEVVMRLQTKFNLRSYEIQQHMLQTTDVEHDVRFKADQIDYQGSMVFDLDNKLKIHIAHRKVPTDR